MRRPIDHTGKRFGKWKVLKHLGKQYWRCVCECGTIQSIYAGNLVSGKTTQCIHCRTIIVAISKCRYQYRGILGLKAIAESIDVTYQCLQDRMYHRGMTLEQAVKWKRRKTKTKLYKELGVSRQGFVDYRTRHTYRETMDHYKGR